jgi:hypothetical protein
MTIDSSTPTNIHVMTTCNREWISVSVMKESSVVHLCCGGQKAWFTLHYALIVLSKNTCNSIRLRQQRAVDHGETQTGHGAHKIARDVARLGDDHKCCACVSTICVLSIQQ